MATKITEDSENMDPVTYNWSIVTFFSISHRFRVICGFAFMGFPISWTPKFGVSAWEHVFSITRRTTRLVCVEKTIGKQILALRSVCFTQAPLLPPKWLKCETVPAPLDPQSGWYYQFSARPPIVLVFLRGSNLAVWIGLQNGCYNCS